MHICPDMMLPDIYHFEYRVSKNYQSHINYNCLLFYLVSLPSIYRWVGNQASHYLKNVASASRFYTLDITLWYRLRYSWPAMCENSLMPDTVTSACRFMWSVHRPMKIGTGNELPDACFMWQASGKPSTSQLHCLHPLLVTQIYIQIGT